MDASTVVMVAAPVAALILITYALSREPFDVLD